MKGRPARAQAAPATYLEMPVGEFLEALSAARPDPGGGSTAALTVTLAASLCMMAASLSGYQLPQAEHVAEEARRLRDRLVHGRAGQRTARRRLPGNRTC